jgi:chromosomal replication initiator protein
MGAPRPHQAPVVSIEKPPAKPQEIDAGWDGMWFYDLLNVCREPRQTVPVKEIQEAVCRYYGVSMLDLLSHRRTRDINVPRQVAMYLCRTLTAHSYAQLGRRFGGRDHTTVIHSAQKIEGLLGYDLKLTCDVNTLRKVLA